MSAWGQFWFDLSALHRVHGAGITTPLCTHLPHPAHRGRYYSTWVYHSPHGAIYYGVDGETMTEMLRDGLRKTGTYNLRMKIALLAVLLEEIEFKLARADQ